MKISATNSVLSTQNDVLTKKNGSALLSGIPNRDGMAISSLGSNLAGKIRFKTDFSILSSATETDPNIRLMNRSIKEVGNLLEEMQTLAEQALDESLSEENRIDLQIQMTRLQAQLFKKTYAMSLELASKSSGNFNMNQLNSIDYDEKLTLKMLERKRKRLYGEETANNGKLLIEERTMMRVEASPQTKDFIEVTVDKETGRLVPGKFISKEDLGGGTFLTGEAYAGELIAAGKVMTDEERMAKISLSLMDAKSAKDSAGKIGRNLADLAKMQADFRAELAKVDMSATVASAALLETQSATNSASTALGLMVAAHSNYGEDVLHGSDPISADVRLTDANDTVGSIFQRLDMFFKDKINKRLGISKLWNNGRNITYA